MKLELNVYTLDFQVRDYECDMQGIVNNAVYQHYFEHTRHEFLKRCGYRFAEITKTGINLVVYRAELDYLVSLQNDEQFTSSLQLERISRTRCIFNQVLFRDDVIFTKGCFHVAGYNQKKKPINLDEINIELLIKNANTP